MIRDLHTTRPAIRRIPRPLVAAAVVGALLASHPVDGQIPVDLPTETTLTTPRVELELTDARVTVTIDAAKRARLAARPANPDTDGLVRLEVEQTPRVVTRIWRSRAEGRAPPIVVELDLTPDQVLVIAGERLQVEIVDERDHTAVANSHGPADAAAPTDAAPTTSDAPSAEGGAGLAITVSLTDSELRAHNLRGLILTATGGSNDLDGISGPLGLDLRETAVHARRLRAQVTLRAVASEVTFDECEGSISVNMDGGLLVTNGSSVSVQGELANAAVELRSVSKTVRLTGSGSEVRIIDAAKVPVQIDGTDLQIFLDDMGGPFRATLTGGSIETTSIGTRIDLNLTAGAEADLDTVDGDLAMVMADGARARVRDVVGHMRVRLEESDLDVSGLKSLDLHARGGSVTGAGIGQLKVFEIYSAGVDLRLTDIQGIPKMVLKGATTAFVQLPTPCRVVAKMPDTSRGDQLKVRGCFLDFDGTRKKGIHRGLDGRDPIQLNATLDETATLEVDGYP